MPMPHIPAAEAERFFAAIEDALRKGYPPPGVPVNARFGSKGALRVAAEAFSIPPGGTHSHLNSCRRVLGREPDWSLWSRPASPEIPHIATVKPPPPQPPQDAKPAPPLAEAVHAVLRKGPLTLEEIAGKVASSPGQVLDALLGLQASGVNLHRFGDRWSLEKTPAPAHARAGMGPYVSRPDGTYLFGFTSDNHLGSKYARLDVLGSLYDHFAEQQVDRVFNAGNWVDGEASFNKHDLLVHGMDAQLRYLAEHYPQRPGISTYAVTGDDHEGWWAQREGVDPGKYAERVMRQAGREDWIDCGFMESFIPLRHAETGAESMLHLMHPGGGSAYAVSYTVQKIVEGYDGGEKPAVLLAGHYHKLSYNMVRNVHAIQTGTSQDQTPFMRKKKIPAHVGGGICRLRQDPRTGAITACRVEFFNYFVQGYYDNRWSHSGDVTHADRGAHVR